MLKLETISKQFGGNQVLSDVSISLDPDIPITGLIGPNGSGKSTLFNVVMGFYHQDAGSVLFKGKNLDAMAPEKRCHEGLSCTFQDSRMLSFMTVLENLTAIPTPQYGESLWRAFFTPAMVKTQELEIKEKAFEILELLHLTPLADQPAGSLSYGQRKLLEIGRVMMTNPSLVLLDEPTAGINPTLIQSLVKILETLVDRGMRFFLVEHNMPLVSQLCDRVLVLDAGELIFNGTPEAARKDNRVVQAYLGSESNVKA